MMAAAEQMPDEDRLRSLLVGKKVTSAVMLDEMPDGHTPGPTGVLTLSDGTVLRVWGNDGGYACDAGCYPLTDLNTCDNAITNVIVEEEPGEDDKCPTCGEWSCDHRGWYRIFVVAEDSRQLLASFEGSDGNGYYGTGWWLSVASEPEKAAV